MTSIISLDLILNLGVKFTVLLRIYIKYIRTEGFEMMIPEFGLEHIQIIKFSNSGAVTDSCRVCIACVSSST